jgi:hypothetical protein
MPRSTQKTVASRSARRARHAPPVRIARGWSYRAVPAERASHTRLLQPALRVGAANDPLEREAETTAERIVSMPAPQMAAPDASAEGTGVASSDAMRAADDQPSTDALETDPPIPEDHIDPNVPPAEDVDAGALTAADLTELETGVPVDTGGDPPLAETPAPAGAEVALPARDYSAVIGAEGGPAPADVARRVSDPGAGRPLPRDMRAFMEPRFGRDFASVRIHDASDDRRAAHRIGARAFTHRDHIWIGPDESASDRKLMAHELTHVVQQTAPGPAKAAARSETGEPQIRRGYVRNKAEKYARNIPGYRLISLIIGKSPITGDTVERNATNVLGALLSLIPGGNLLFERLEESRVIEEAFEWVWSRLMALNITWTRIRSLISDLLDYLMDWPSDVIDYAKKLFRPLVEDILTFIGEVMAKILEFIVRGALKLAGPWGEKVWEIIQAAGAVLMTILEDPLGFAKNLFSAVVKGFKQFGSNIWEHIKKGLLGWLFGALQGLDLKMPERLDFKGLISIGLQIVGLTYEHFRKVMVKKLGANGERKMAFIEKSVEAVKILVKEGFVGLWQRVFQMIDNFRETVLGGIRDFVIKSLIMGGISWLAGLSNPVGAVVKVVLSIYNMIVTFLERLDQILEVARSIFASIGAIAAGRIQEAADFIERTMAATIPVVISFLAALVPVTGITNSIRTIIAKLRDAVNRAIDRLVTFVTKKAQKLFSKLISKINSKRKLPSANFRYGETDHRIYAEKRGKAMEIMIATTPHTAKETAAQGSAEAKKIENKKAQAEAGEGAAEAAEANQEAGAEAKKLKPESQKDNQLKGFAALEAELKEAAGELQAAGADAASYPEIDTRVSEYLFRAKEPRFDTIEGASGEYSMLGETTSQVIRFGDAEDPAKRRYSDFYENDHIPEKQFAKAILANIDRFRPGAPGGDIDRDSEKAEAEAGAAPAEPPSVGKLGATIKSIPKDGKGLPAMSIYRPVHKIKGATPADKASGKVQAAAKSADPVGAIKKEISGEIKKEADKIVAILRKDASASDAIRGKVDTGMASLIAENTAIYGLDKVEEPQKAAAPGAKPDASLSKLPLTGNKEAGIPDFLKIEGEYKPHDQFDEGFGKYLEYDHVIDAAWPRHTQELSFGHPLLKAKIADRLESAQLDKADKSTSNRLASLGDKKIFGATQGMRKYTFETGHAIAVYRPVHRAVTRATKPPRDDTAPAAAIGDGFVEPLAKFIETGDLTELGNARASAQADLRKLFDAKTDEHIDHVADQYVVELQAVKKINKQMEAAAQQAMVAISSRVRDGLVRARGETAKLF